MKITVKKLWHGSASVRDYIVSECIEKKEDIVIHYKGSQMTVPWTELYRGVKNKEVFASQHNYRKYSLVDFPWKQDAKVTPQLF